MDPMGGAVPTNDSQIAKMRAELANKDRFDVLKQTPADTIEPLTNPETYKDILSGFASAGESALQGGVSGLFGGIGDILHGVKDMSVIPGHPANLDLFPGSEVLKNYLPTFEKPTVDGKEIPTFLGVPYATSQDYRTGVFSNRLTPEFGDKESNEYMQGLGSVVAPFALNKIAQLEREALEVASKIPGMTRDGAQKFAMDYVNATRGIYPEGGSPGALAADLAMGVKKGAKTAGNAAGNVAKGVEDVTVGNYQRSKVRKAASNAPADEVYNPLRQRVAENYEPGMPMYMMQGDKSLLPEHHVNVQKAKELERQGQLTSEQIWNQTGAGRGLDPRHYVSEIPGGDQARFTIDSSQVNNPNLKLLDIFKFPNLYKAYPFLADQKVKFKDLSAENAKAMYVGKIIYIDPKMIGHPSEYGRIPHEVSHVISRHEGWPSGTSPEVMPDYLVLSAAKEIQGFLDQKVTLENAIKWTDEGYKKAGLGGIPDAAIRLVKENQANFEPTNQFDMYKYNAGEQQAELDRRRLGYSDEELQANYPFKLDPNPVMPTFGMTINPEHALIETGRTFDGDHLFTTSKQLNDEIKAKTLAQKKAELKFEDDQPSKMAIKPKGGNFEDKVIDRTIAASLHRGVPAFITRAGPNWIEEVQNGSIQPPLTEEQIKNYTSMLAVNKWLDTRLKSYIKNDLGTPKDPVRELMDQGISHMGDIGEDRVITESMQGNIEHDRKAQQQPPEGYAQTDAGKEWEYRSDYAITPHDIKSFSEANPTRAKNAGFTPEIIAKDPNAKINILGYSIHDLGFDHLADELSNAVSPTTDLPNNFRLTPQQLERMTVPEAVRHVAKINKYRSDLADKAHVKNFPVFQQNFPAIKTYENGSAWHEISLSNVPSELPEGWKVVKTNQNTETANNVDVYGLLNDQKFFEGKFYDTPEEVLQSYVSPKSYDILDKALKEEGTLMGHCVGGYTNDVVSGKSRIFTLRDAKGKPHVTIEVKPESYMDRDNGLVNSPDGSVKITQIKGKSNTTIKRKYEDQVLDFIRNDLGSLGKVVEVNDIVGTGIVDTTDVNQVKGYITQHQLGKITLSDLSKKIHQAQLDDPTYSRYMSTEELNDIVNPPVASKMAIKSKGGQWPINFGPGELAKQGGLGKYITSSLGYPLNSGHAALSIPVIWARQRLGLPYQNQMEDYMIQMDEDADRTGRPRVTDEVMTEMLNNTFAPDPPLKTPSELKVIQDAYNSWINGPFKNYITKLMGTGADTDPLVKLAEKGYVPIDHESVGSNGESSRIIASALNTTVFNDPFQPKQTATTDLGKSLEDALDSSIYATNPKMVSAIYGSENMPYLSKVDPDKTKIYDLNSQYSKLLDENAGFHAIKKQVWADLMSGKETPETIKNRPIEHFAKQVWVNPIEEARKAAKDAQLYHTYREKRHQELPADMTYPDGSKMVVFNKATFDNAANAKDVIRDMSVDTKDLNHCAASGGFNCSPQYNKRHAPVFEPHTGFPPAKTKGFPVYSHISNIQSGLEEFASLRAPDGEAKASLQLEEDPSKPGKKVVYQIKGPNNLEVDPAYRSKVKDYLNDLYHQDKLSSVSDRELENIATYDLQLGRSFPPPVGNKFDDMAANKAIIDPSAIYYLKEELQREGMGIATNWIDSKFKQATGASIMDEYGEHTDEFFNSRSNNRLQQQVTSRIESNFYKNNDKTDEEIRRYRNELQNYILALEDQNQAISLTLKNRFMDPDDLIKLAQDSGVDILRKHEFKPDHVFSGQDRNMASLEYDIWREVIRQERNRDPRDVEYVQKLIDFIESTRVPGFKKGGIIKLVQSTNPPLAQKKAELSLRNTYA